jgi:hypothetical protein
MNLWWPTSHRPPYHERFTQAVQLDGKPLDETLMAWKTIPSTITGSAMRTSVIRIDDLETKIKLIKQRRAPKGFTEARDKVLSRAEAARQSSKETPAWLNDARPPWDKNNGLATTRYD